MRWSLLAVVVVSLSGCAVVPIPYRGPDTGPAATITYKNASSQHLQIWFFNQSRRCVGRRRLEGGIEPGTERTAEVRAGEELTFEYILGDRRYCLAYLRFTPRDGAAYQFDTIDDPDRCLWRMLDVSNEQPQPVELQRIPIPWLPFWDENSSFCSE